MPIPILEDDSETVSTQTSVVSDVPTEIAEPAVAAAVTTPTVTDENFVTAETNVRGGNPARHWVFTIQIDADDYATQIRREAWRPPSVDAHGHLRYVVCQRERGSNTNRLHWQGYLQVRNAVRSRQVRTLLNCDWAWVKPARGTPQQARAYCMKEDSRVPGTSPYESGSLVEQQGKRCDLADVYAAVKDGASPSAILDMFPSSFIKYHRGIERAAFVASSQRASTTERDVNVVCVYGPPGTGKTRWAYDTYGYSDVYSLTITPGRNLWWDGYHGQKVVLIDDFSGNLPFRYLLRLCDRFPMQVEIKGGTVYLEALTLVFTSNLHWSDWYRTDQSATRDIRALQRRITKVVHVPVFGAEPIIQERGSPASDPENWVALPVDEPYAPGFVPPPSV